MPPQHDTEAGPELGFARLAEVLRLSGLSEATIDRRAAAGTFPASTKLGDRAVGWRRAALNEWLAAPATWREKVVEPAIAPDAAQDAPAQDAPQ